jgi:hypothetical protein
LHPVDKVGGGFIAKCIMKRSREDCGDRHRRNSVRRFRPM